MDITKRCHYIWTDKKKFRKCPTRIEAIYFKFHHDSKIYEILEDDDIDSNTKRNAIIEFVKDCGLIKKDYIEFNNKIKKEFIDAGRNEDWL